MKIIREIKEESIHSYFIENVDELLKDLEVKNGCLAILPSTEILLKKGSCGMIPFDLNVTENDEKYQLILLMRDVGLIDRVEEEKTENGSTNALTFSFQPDKVRNFIDRANGKNSEIKRQTLEFLARHIGDLASGPRLVEFLKNLGVSESLIVYPNTKWRMVFDVLLYYASSPNGEDHMMLSKIIEEAVHPLMYNGNKNLAAEMVDKFNGYLTYDSKHLGFDEEENRYKLYFTPNEEEKQEIMAELDAEVEQKEKRQFDFLCQSENKEKISLLRKNYQILMGVLETFCRNFSQLPHEDIIELNKHYLALDKDVWNAIDELKIATNFDTYKKYPRPFSNLFSAEKELNGEINWDVIRREMSARFGEIETIYQKVNASDILSEPDKQKQLNSITLYLSELKEKINTAKPKEVVEKPPVSEMKIIEWPELAIKGFAENVILPKPKNKKLQVRTFPKDLKWQEITIKFLNDQEAIVNARKLTFQTNYEAMGFQDDKRKLPNKQWTLLKLLSVRSGEISWDNNNKLPTTQINAIKKQKQTLSEALKAYFQIDEDPFMDYKKEGAYKIKLNLVPENPSVALPSKDADDEIEKFRQSQSPGKYRE